MNPYYNPAIEVGAKVFSLRFGEWGIVEHIEEPYAPTCRRPYRLSFGDQHGFFESAEDLVVVP